MSLLPDYDSIDATTVASQPSLGRLWLRRLSITAGALAATLIAGGGVYLASVNQNIDRADLITGSAAAAPQSAKGALNIAVLGAASADKTSPETGEGSVVMVLHISADRKQASLVSFPSDTYVAIPEEGWGRLSSTYALGGAKLTVKTLEKTLNTRIDHAMVAQYEGFQALTQQVGSVTIENPDAFVNNGVLFDKGAIKVTSEQAIEYVKTAPGEVGTKERAARQRVLLEAGMQKGLSRNLLKNPVNLNKFVSTVTKNTTVDKGFDAKEIARIANSLRLSRNDVTLVRVPLAADLLTKNGEEVRKVDPQRFEALASAVSSDSVDTYVKSNPTK